MKNCVLTHTFSCDPMRVWLYLTNPTLQGWRRDVKSAELSDDGMHLVETAPRRQHHRHSLLGQRKAPPHQLHLCARARPGRVYRHPAGRRRFHQRGVHHAGQGAGAVCQAQKAAGGAHADAGRRAGRLKKSIPAKASPPGRGFPPARRGCFFAGRPHTPPPGRIPLTVRTTRAPPAGRRQAACGRM